MSKKRLNKQTQRYISKIRIETLFNLAEKYAMDGKLNLANRYVKHARNISMKNLTPIPKQYKQQFCKHCYHYFLPQITCRIRINRGKIIKYCFNCNKITRIPLRNQNKSAGMLK